MQLVVSLRQGRAAGGEPEAREYWGSSTHPAPDVAEAPDVLVPEETVQT